MTIDQLASSIYNDLVGGNLIPTSNRQLISLEQLEDECAEERATVLKEWYLKGAIKKGEYAFSLNCVPVDCKDQNKCTNCGDKIDNAKIAKHFEIPELLTGMGQDAVIFCGSTDRLHSFKVYFDLGATKFNQYRRKKSPYVYIERTPNENNMYDCWVFNAPMVKHICMIAVFKDLRQLQLFDCCRTEPFTDFGAISNEVKKRIIQKKIQLYRTAAPAAPQLT